MGSRSDLRDSIPASVRLESLNDAIAKLAGEALAATGSSNAMDAIVMASAAQRGDVVYTSDHDDLVRFCSVFPGVRVFRV